ncbi:MAG TPA: phosphodiesterase [bacterium]|nr:phosphodiesterase [bacterium]HOL67481.1 phosphodiesterase [bacterium]HPP11621.1 phosphodiesterase [bacterium]
MKIGIISDTHGSLAGWRKAWPFLKETEVIIHCGDVFNHGPGNPMPETYSPRELAEELNRVSVPLLVVKGNCDSEVDQLFLKVPFLSPVGLYQIDHYRFLFSHGHLFPQEKWLSLGQDWQASFLLSGHTHQACLVKKEKLLLCNPGSLSLPKDGPATLVLIDLKIRTISLLELPDGSTRQQLSF